MTIPIPLQESLQDSITSGSFVDTKFWVFSKRARSNPGRVGEPKALFVNGRVAKRVPRLGAMLEGRKTEENLRVRFPTDRKPYTRTYDYDDDSDLEDDDGEISDDDLDASPQAATEDPGNDSELVTVVNSDAKSSEFSDIVSISDLGSIFSESSDGKSETNPDPFAHVGKVVVIEDVAFVTFQALLRYLYTNEIEFAPWGSVERRKSRALEAVSESYGIPKPSPKSIYRLADKYDIPELRELALQQIQQDLSKCNILKEVFSKYTSWYPEIRRLELRQLARELLSSDSSTNSQLLKEAIKSYTGGELPHAKHVIPALYDLIESDEPTEETPLPAAASTSHGTAGWDWTGLKKALTSSLTSGTFLDSQFYAVESRSPTSPSKIRPIYFCSKVGGILTSILMAGSSKFKPRKTPFRYECDYDSDVDDEEPDQVRTVECYPSSKCVQESPTTADLRFDSALLLGSGAAKTWGAIFLYVYTGLINFTTIDSYKGKGVQSDCPEGETNPPHDPEDPSIPPPDLIAAKPCSPKSIYYLADKVGLTGLRATAFEVIRSQLNKNNIVQELFSPFTAEHKDVREMEYELFQSKLKPLVDRALLFDMIESSSSGEHPYRTAAVELILERSIQERRERISAKVESDLQPDLVPEPKRTTTTPIPEAKPPAPAPQLPFQPSSSSVPTLTSAKNETSPNSSSSSKPARKAKATGREGPPAHTKLHLGPPDVVVELVCGGCRVNRSRSKLCIGLYCPSCPTGWDIMKCVRCGTIRAEKGETCTNCHGKFK